MIRWFSIKRLIMPTLLFVLFLYYLKVRRQQNNMESDRFYSSKPIKRPPSALAKNATPEAVKHIFAKKHFEKNKETVAESSIEVVDVPSIDASTLKKPFKTRLDAVSRRPFEMTEADIKRDFSAWNRQKVSLPDILWNSYQVVIIPVARIPEDEATLYQVFKQSIIRHVSIFYGDYQRAGGTGRRQFPIPECSEIGLGRDDNETSSKALDELAGSQGDIKFKKIPYFDGKRKGVFLTDDDGGVSMVTKYFKIREKPDKKKKKDFEDEAAVEKKLRRNKEKSRQNYHRELSALNALSHPNIVHGICKIESRLQIVYPFLKGGDLVPLDKDLLGLSVRGRSGEVLNPDKTFMPHFAKHLFKAVRHMHQAGYIHLDLKPENFVIAGPDRSFTRQAGSPDLEAYHLVLIDFGLSEVEARLGDGCIKSGTEVTMAPEQALCNAPVGYGTDWWGVAASLFRIRTFWEPSISEKTRSALLHYRDKQWGHVAIPVEQPFFSRQFKDLLEMMLVPHPEDREFDDKMDELLNHPYVKDVL